MIQDEPVSMASKGVFDTKRVPTGRRGRQRTLKIQNGETMTRTTLKMMRLIRMMPLEQMVKVDLTGLPGYSIATYTFQALDPSFLVDFRRPHVCPQACVMQPRR